MKIIKWMADHKEVANALLVILWTISMIISFHEEHVANIENINSVNLLNDATTKFEEARHLKEDAKAGLLEAERLKEEAESACQVEFKK